MERQATTRVSFPTEVDDNALHTMFFHGAVMQIAALEFDGEVDGVPTYKVTFSEVDPWTSKLPA